MRLKNGKQQINGKRNIKHADQREQHLFQSETRYVITGGYGADDESNRSERSVHQPVLLVRQSDSSFLYRIFQKQRHDFHHQSLGKTIQENKHQVNPNEFLTKKADEHLPKLLSLIPETSRFFRFISGKHPPMIDSHQKQNNGTDKHNRLPRLRNGKIHRTYKPSGKKDQSPVSQHLS